MLYELPVHTLGYIHESCTDDTLYPLTTQYLVNLNTQHQQRDRIVTNPTTPSRFESQKFSIAACLTVTLVAFALRFYKLGHPDQVVYVSFLSEIYIAALSGHTLIGPAIT